MKNFGGRDPAQALAWFVVMMPLFLAVIGLAVDGEAVLRAHRRAQGAADGAARTGVGHVLLDHARAQPGAPDVLDPTAAERAAADYVAQVYPDLQVKTAADERHLIVVVTQQVSPTFLQLVHVTALQVQARSEAQPKGGIDRPVT
jgi:Flp pilus assembly protein TadG